MSTVAAWLVVGVPALALAAGLFAGRSVVRATFGYLVLTATFLFFLLIVDSSVSAGIVAAVFFLLVASGRGQDDVEETPVGHQVPFRVDDPEIDEPRRV